jgi:hypothetical protein
MMNQEHTTRPQITQEDLSLLRLLKMVEADWRERANQLESDLRTRLANGAQLEVEVGEDLP